MTTEAAVLSIALAYLLAWLVGLLIARGLDVVLEGES